MTAEEAEAKWCPYSSTGAYTDRGPMTAVTVNRDPRPEVSEACLCMASACMAWRWTMNQSGIPSRDDGFCGLAGKP